MSDTALSSIDTYLRLMAKHSASDCYLTAGARPAMKINGVMKPVSNNPLDAATTRMLAEEILSDQQMFDFESLMEMNTGIERAGVGRFRVNLYYQRGDIAMVIRYIKSQIPTVEELNLPALLKEQIMHKTGLILVVGSTGSGKSSTLAAMLDHRNEVEAGHILTIEDPIEYSFKHKKSIVGQREVGLDTLSYENALKEAMREAPDVIMIGEIRDRATMEHALAFADTGHLCISTLHATNANQALDRIVNFFDRSNRDQILMDLSMNLRAIISQRLVKGRNIPRVPAIEIMLNSPFIGELIKAGRIDEIKEAIGKGGTLGMQTFDQSLLELYLAEMIEMKEALDHADSRSDLEWKINFGGGVNALKKEKEEARSKADKESADPMSSMPKLRK